ncbi:MAG: DNA starvation/stationary phase protection protein [Hyphomicrobiales bacterium]|nr:DNA starvation/stationary phase protection protein [Hyphomicrobiales bacterium]
MAQKSSNIQQALASPAGLSPESVKAISASLNLVLADAFALYLKTKNFHWHMTGRHFRDYHLLLDEQAAQIYGITDDVAERVRKVGGRTLKSIGHISKLQAIKDNDKDDVSPSDMLNELREDNAIFIEDLRKAHEAADDANDAATTSMIEVWLDEAERRQWFLFETVRGMN